MNKKKQSNEHIQVFVRCRPLSKSEQNLPVPVEVHPDVNKILIKDNGTDKSIVKTFSFDKVFGPDAKQVDIYTEVAAPIIQEVLMGFNCTIFAYGQTGTGKTFTIEGGRSENLEDISEDQFSGIIPRSMKHLFSNLTEQNMKFEISVSFLELYNEEIFDLISKTDDPVKLRIFDSSMQKGSVIVQGLETKPVTSMKEVYSILDKGFRKRRKAATLLNKASSRSHTLFTVTVNLKECSSTFEKMKSGKLNLVDLAGSENIGRSGASNKRAREAGSINQSLLTLGRVITSLCEKAVHIPYRESKLTRLLQDSLGGQTKTAIIATISPSMLHINETLNTLEYALRAMNIANKPELNTQVTATSLTKDYVEEIIRLRGKIYELAARKGFYVPEENIKRWEYTLASKREERLKVLNLTTNLEIENKLLDTSIQEANNNLIEKRNQLEAAKARCKEYKLKLQKEKEDSKLHEATIYGLQHYSEHIHEKFHADMEEKQNVESELLKMKEKLKATAKQEFDLQEKLRNIRENLSKRNEKLHLSAETLLKNINDSCVNMNSLTSECNDYMSLLKNSFESASTLFESKFKTLFRAVSDLEGIEKSFQDNIALVLNEDKSRMLKWFDEFYEVYLSSNESAVLEPLNNTLKELENSVFEISSKVNDWKIFISSEMNNRQNLMQELLDNQKAALETITDDINALLKKQKENLMAYNDIITDCVNSGATIKSGWNDQFLVLERALSSLDLFCTEYIQCKIDKTSQASTCLKNSRIEKEISDKLSLYCANFVQSIDAAQKEVDLHESNAFSREWEEMLLISKSSWRRNLRKPAIDEFYFKLLKKKKGIDASRMKYKDLNTELSRLSSTLQGDELSKHIEDLSKTKPFSENSTSSYFQDVLNSISKCGDCYKTCLLENQIEIDALVDKNKMHMGKLTDLSKLLATSLIQKVPDYIQYIEKDLKISLEDNRENESGTEGGTENAIFDANSTITSADCLKESTALNECECPVCFLKTSDETLRSENDSHNLASIQCSDNGLKSPVKKFQVQPEASGSKSFSHFQRSPIRRPSSRYDRPARRHLEFIDVEKIAEVLQSSSNEDL